MARPTESQFFRQSCLAVLVDRRGPHGKATPSACTAWAGPNRLRLPANRFPKARAGLAVFGRWRRDPNRALGREARTLWHHAEGRVARKREIGRAEERRVGKE